MYTDINDLAVELFGWKTVTDNLVRNGGAGIWDLYFEVVASHARHYRAFQKCFFINNDANMYFLNDLFLIPGCRAEAERKAMSREEAEHIISLSGKPLTSHEYIKTVIYLCEFRIPDEQLQVLLKKQLENRKKEWAGNSLYSGKTVCRQKLSKMFPMWSDVVFDNTAQAMNVFNDITSAKEVINRLFLKSLDNGFKKELTISGSVLWASLVRNYYADDPETDNKSNREVYEELFTRFEETYLSYHTLPGDNADFWEEMVNYEPDDLLNNAMFARLLPFASMRKEKEHMMHLEYFFNKTAKLNDYYQNYKEIVVTAYMYDKATLDHVLLKRVADADCKAVKVSRTEIMLLFINRLPVFEDNRKLMAEETVMNLEKYLVKENSAIDLIELLWLLQMADKQRPDEKTLIRWTEQYFETELQKMS